MKTPNQAAKDAGEETVRWAVDGAVYGVMDRAVWGAVNRAVNNAVYRAADRAVTNAVWDAGRNDPRHPALQDFLHSAEVRAR